MSSEPDLEGYEGDTSICVSDGRSDTPHMTTSDDILVDPAFWLANPEKERLLRAQIFGPTVSAAIPAVICDLESVTEPESEPEVLHITPNPPCTIPAVICDPESVTEPESEPETHTTPPCTIPAVACDPESVTEPESEPETHTTPPCTTPAVACDPESVTEPESEPETHTIPTVVSITPKPKKKDWTDFFATPSPPSPTSNYWKYVTREEDAAWYDRAGTDDRFHVVRQMKRELRELCDTK
ncbi:hypothetical protein EDD22DRAFT_1054625 [Suillus occidentalis]|nr:hypothetical protein EDD22DRAFT_1054625 [Suillus occidentalis]